MPTRALQKELNGEYQLRRGLVALALLAIAWFGLGQGAVGQDVSQVRGGDSAPAHRLRTERFLAGRHGPEAARLLARARAASAAMPRTTPLGMAWTSVGPAQITSPTYGALTGRVTALALDPADSTGNTVYVGATGGGVWKSTNAAGPASAVSFTPLTDTLPAFSQSAGSSATASLSIGALGLANGVLLAGTGDPNDATDSYYGSGLLRSNDGGVSWTLIQGSNDGAAGNHSFFGLSFAGFAFSSANPSLVVAALGQSAEGTLVNAPDTTYSIAGLYFSTDAGVTWQMASIYDGSQPVQSPQLTSQGPGNSVTSVVWNPLRQRFYAAVRFHGYYDSPDGQTWTRLANQPGTGLTAANCPHNLGYPGNVSCPIFRGALAVQPLTGDTFALTTDVYDQDQGLFQDLCAASGSACGNGTVLFSRQLPDAVLETGNGSKVIPQADYDLELAAVASGSDTVLYAGTVDLFRCSLNAGCTLRNTTNAQNGCTTPAGVAPSQHALAPLPGGTLVFLGNDGGLYRSTDGASEGGAVCSSGDASHFQNLNPALGSLGEVVSFAQDPVSPATLLAGLGALGTAGTGSAQTGAQTAWPQLSAGEGGSVAIDAANPLNWYLSNGAGVSLARCTRGAACQPSDFAGTPAIGAAQVANDPTVLDAPWMLDPALTVNVLIGTCRAWRGPATGTGWPGSNQLSQPFGSSSASTCSSGTPVVRSLAAGGPASPSGAASNQGSRVLYAGLAGADDGGQALGGHLFTTAAANTASSATVWTDVALSPLTTPTIDGTGFNPGGFDVSSVTADPHDATGLTVYATLMGFTGNGINQPHVYRSVDGGAHWTNINSNLPNAPANALVVDPNDANTVYIATDTGVYVSTHVSACGPGLANCWSLYGTGLPNAPVTGLAAAVAMSTGSGSTGELRAATYGRGIWQIPLLTAQSPAAPGLSVTPTTLSFAAQPVGTQSTAMTVTVSNPGTAALTVSSITTTGDFNQTNGCTSTAIPPGGTCTVQVSFLPTATGSRSGLLTVYGNAPGGQATVALTGAAIAGADIVLTPTSLTFPATTVGALSAVQNITVSNTGGTTASLTSETVSGAFTITQNTCNLSLAPDTGCTLSIAFAPTQQGAATGSLTVVDSAGTQTANLAGSGGTPPTDTLSPNALTFSAQVLNTSSAAQQVTLTNTGSQPLTLISAQITSGDFQVVNGCGATLSGGASCALSVTFAPTKLGLQTGILTVTDSTRSQQVALSGQGIAPAGVSLSPTGGLSFPATALGATAAPQSVTLTNNGGVALTVSGVTVTGDFSLVTNACGATVAAGASCAIGVGFTPTAGGTRTGALTVTSSAAGSPQALPLTGAGIDFTVAADGPTSASVPSGGTASFLVLVNSPAGVTGTAAMSCTGAPTNARCTVNPTSVALGAGQVVTVTIATGVSLAAVQTPSPKFLWALLLLPLGLFARRRTLRGLVLFLAITLTLLSSSGCGAARSIPLTTTGGGSGGTTPTPAGSYTLVVSGASAGLTRSLNLSLTVQ